MAESHDNSTNASLAPSSVLIPDEQPARFIAGIFMLVITLFVFFFAIWTYRLNLKRLFEKCWRNFLENGILCCCPWFKHRRERAESGVLNSIIFNPEEESNSNLTESLLSSS